MRCPKCGRDNHPGASFCAYCHSMLTPAVNVQQSGGKKTRTSGSSVLLISLIIGLSVILVGLIVGILIYYFGGSGIDTFSGRGGGGVTYTPENNYNDESSIKLTASATEFNVSNQAVTVYFYAKCDSLDNHIDLADETGTVLVQMMDDGNYYVNGDEVSGDGVYTAKLELDAYEERAYFFTAFDTGSARGADPLKISIIAPLTADELAANNLVDLAIMLLLNDDEYLLMTPGEKAEAVLAMLDELAAEGLIDPDSIYMNEERRLVTYYYTSGVMGGVSYADFMAEENSVSYPKLNVPAFTNAPGSVYYGDAVFLYATDDIYSSRYPVVSQLVNDWNSIGLSTQLDSDVTINDMKHLAGLDFICVDAHGLFYEVKYDPDDKIKWFAGITGTEQQVVNAPSLFLREAPTPDKDRKYSNDLKTGRVIKINGGYGLTSAFFDYYYDDEELKGSVIYFCCCELMGALGDVDEAWSEILLSKNVGAFVAYHNTVFSFYVYDMLSSFVPDIVAGLTVGDALENAKELFGDDDSEWCQIRQVEFDPHSFRAYPILRGSERATLGSGKSWEDQ